jgi:hypothetical protein
MPPAGCEPAITASERPKTKSVDHAATGIGLKTGMMEDTNMYFTTINYPLLETLYLLFTVVSSEGRTRRWVQ